MWRVDAIGAQVRARRYASLKNALPFIVELVRAGRLVAVGDERGWNNFRVIGNGSSTPQITGNFTHENKVAVLAALEGGNGG